MLYGQYKLVAMEGLLTLGEEIVKNEMIPKGNQEVLAKWRAAMTEDYVVLYLLAEGKPKGIVYSLKASLWS